MRKLEPFESKLLCDGVAQLGVDVDLARGIECALSYDQAPCPFIAPKCHELPGGSGIPIGTPVDALEEVADSLSDLGLGKNWLEKQSPQISVDINPFSLATYPVTKLEYLLFELDQARTDTQRGLLRQNLNLTTMFHPAEMSDLTKLDSYIHWLSSRAGRTFRLPTEFEWEYAATQGDGRRFPWGDTWVLGAANTAELGLGRTIPVFCHLRSDQAGPGPFIGMAGNVEEITASSYTPYDPDSPSELDGFARADPRHRVVRGGSFAKWRDLASCQRRHAIAAGSAFGARLAC